MIFNLLYNKNGQKLIVPKLNKNGLYCRGKQNTRDTFNCELFGHKEFYLP